MEVRCGFIDSILLNICNRNFDAVLFGQNLRLTESDTGGSACHESDFSIKFNNVFPFQTQMPVATISRVAIPVILLVEVMLSTDNADDMFSDRQRRRRPRRWGIANQRRSSDVLNDEIIDKPAFSRPAPVLEYRE
jgi:hypothetical protein